MSRRKSFSGAEPSFASASCRENAVCVTILGCGPSGGVPLIGCDCAVCRSGDAKNIRTRASILIEKAQTRVLVDTGPDLRAQALREGIATIDAILYTHAHADHCHGIDDARAFNFHRSAAVPVYGTRETLAELGERFAYAFHPPAEGKGWHRPSLELKEIDYYQSFSIGNIDFLNFIQCHGKVKSSGYRFGNIAYSTDVDKFPENSFQLIEKLDVWIVDCLQPEPSPTHAHLAKTLDWIAQFRPRLAVLTHMSHQLEYHSLRSQLPPYVIPAYDGMRITVSAEGISVV